MKSLMRTLLVAAAAGLAAQASAQAPQPAEPLPAVNYADPDNWLCLPGRADACAIDLTAMRVNPRGNTNVVDFRPARDPRIDCFYVYPTLSPDRGRFSDLNPGPEERQIIAQQFARFSSVCRTFAPIYRQYTLQALGGVLANTGETIDHQLSRAPERGGGAYADVVAAWRHYLSNHNLGRGFVLIGHSQGAMHLTRLLAEEIEGSPAQDRFVSAILLGANVQVPKGLNTGGSFRTIPLCRDARQTGCVITYSSYRDTDPPGQGAFFGQGHADGMIAGCTNPADLRRGRGQPESFFLTGTQLWTGDRFKPVGTPFVTTPGLVTTTCVSGPAGTYLEVHVNKDERGARIDEIPGDIMRSGRRDPNWGLHLVDFNLSMGNLVEIVDRQARAWRPAR